MLDDPGLFGRQWAVSYDGPGNPDPAPAVAFLAGLAGEGPVLELAIGSGRVALPLAARGLAVDGIEASPEMVALLRDKPGGDTLRVEIGDMADVRAPATAYPLVFLIFNTLFNLTTPGRQEDCFRNVARVLTPGGAFVIETFVPDPADFDRDERLEVRTVTEDEVTLRVHRYDRAAQTFLRQTIKLSNNGVRRQPFGMRYQWPEQIDTMAAAAGLHLADRFEDFDRSPFGPGSRTHISVYRK